MALRSDGDVRSDGNVLIGNSLLINCALLLEKKLPLDETNFLDFCNLVNALTFHDKIVTFPVNLPPEISNSSLYTFLRENELLIESTISDYNLSLQDKLEIMDLIGAIVPEEYLDTVIHNAMDRHLNPYNEPWSRYETIIDKHSFHTFPDRSDFGSFLKKESKDRYEFTYFKEQKYSKYESPKEINLERRRFVDDVLKNDKNNELTDNIYSFKRSAIADKLHYIPVIGKKSKEVLQKESFLLRTALYWIIAGRSNISFIPDFMRIPLITEYGIRVKQSIALLIQSKIDEMVRRELEAASAIATPIIIPLPNTMSKFLTRFPSLGFEEAIFSLREEFVKHKKAISQWEKRVEDAKKRGYGEILKVRKELSLSLESLTGEDKTDLALSLTPGIATDILGGTAGISTATPAIEKAINYFKRWKRRRRINYFIDGKKEASRVPYQDELLKKAFGNSLTQAQADRFITLTDRLQNVYKQ